MSRIRLYLLLALFLSTQFTFITADDDSSDEFSSTLVLSDELEGTDSIEDAEVSEAGDEALDDDAPDTDSDSVDIESVDDTSTTSAAEEAEQTEGTASAEEAAETEGTEAADDDDTDSDSASSEESIDDDDMDDIDDTSTSMMPRDIAMDAFEEGSAEENALDEGLASDGRNSGGLVSGKDAQNGTIDSKGVWIAIGSVIGLLVAFAGCGGYWFYNKSKWNGTKSKMDKIANPEMEVCIDQPRVSEGGDGRTPVSDKTAMPSTRYGEVDQEVDDEDINDPLR